MQSWIHSYTPKAISDIVGQQKAVKTILECVNNWTRKSKPLLLWGQTGTGKTSSVLAIAQELGHELLEVNASDSRNKDAIESLVGGAVKQASLFANKKIILVDEIEGLSGTKDRGGLAALIKVIHNSPYPVILTAQDPFTQKLKAARKACELVEFSFLSSEDMNKKLAQILKKEGISFIESDLNKISMSVGGDLRAAINDIQMCSTHGKLDCDTSILSQRERPEQITSALMRVFKTTQASVARGSFDRVDADIDEIMLWLDHNLSEEYKNILDLSRAYQSLSRADTFVGRIRRWQYYRFYVYIYDLLTAGIALAKDEKYKGASTYKQSTRPLMIWMANQKYAKRKAIAEKIAARTHSSTRRALPDVWFLQYIARNAKIDKEVASLDLSKEELDWLQK